MKNFLSALSMLVVTALGAQPASAVTLSFNPATANISQGATVNMNVVVSGLENENLAALDLVVNYNPAVLTFGSYMLGDGLGLLGIEADDWSMGDAGGQINLAELSYLADFSFQADSFTLATLSFAGQNIGSSSITFSNILLSDEGGNSLAASLGIGAITVGDGGSTSVVPEPTTMVLFATGVAGLVGARRKRTNKELRNNKLNNITSNS